MQCTSPIFRLKDAIYFSEDAYLASSLPKKRFYNFKDFYYLTEKNGLNPDFFTKLGCGQCLSCRLNHAKEWAERCMLEAKYHDNNYFITLTYNDENLPFSPCGVPTLKKCDVQLFHKRLRKEYGKFRFFLGAEYGDKSFRPHYHVIYFGLNIEDLIFLKLQRSKSNVYEYFTSPSIERIWGKGFITITKVTAETCAYTARYSLKKRDYRKLTASETLNNPNASDKEIHNALQATGEIQPVYSLMSRRPGIARDYYEENKRIITERDIIPDSVLKHIRYYDKLFEADDEKKFNHAKQIRQTLTSINSRDKSSYSQDEYLDVLRENFIAENKVKRDKV